MKRVVIIGGGLAGLSAALCLADTGSQVAVVEARHAFGGRTFSFVDRESGDVLDNGQHVLMGCCHATLRYAQRIGVEHLFLRLKGMSLEFHHADGRSAKLQAGRAPHPVGLLQGFFRYRLLSVASRFAVLRVGLALRSMSHNDIATLHAVSASDWLRSAGQKDDAMEHFWTPVILATLNAQPEQASAGYLATVLREIFLTGAASADVLIPAGGLSQVLIDNAVSALRLGGTELLVRHAVERISMNADAQNVVHCANGVDLHCDAVICAMPPWALASVLNASGLDSAVAHALSAFRPSPIISIHVWLRNDPKLALMTGALGTTIQWLFNKGVSADGSFRISCTISAAHDLAGASVQDIQALVRRELPLLIRGLNESDIIRSKAIREHRATFVPAPSLDASRPASTTDIPNLFLAGDYTKTGLPATMESAILSGERAAAFVLERTTERSCTHAQE
jgi:hydroxysqualene dehydroxylase